MAYVIWTSLFSFSEVNAKEIHCIGTANPTRCRPDRPGSRGNHKPGFLKLQSYRDDRLESNENGPSGRKGSRLRLRFTWLRVRRPAGCRNGPNSTNTAASRQEFPKKVAGLVFFCYRQLRCSLPVFFGASLVVRECPSSPSKNEAIRDQPKLKEFQAKRCSNGPKNWDDGLQRSGSPTHQGRCGVNPGCVGTISKGLARLCAFGSWPFPAQGADWQSSPINERIHKNGEHQI